VLFRSYPGQLSGGEQQRVALARAIAPRPSVLFADEPTGNLDGQTGADVADLLFALHARAQTTLFLVTHEENLAQRCERIVRLKDGRIVADTRKP
jgi:putative ABC transport system ATP-binding protein